MTRNPSRTVLSRFLPPLAGLAALLVQSGCVVYPAGYEGGPGYAYVPAPVVVAPIFRAPYYGPHGGWHGGGWHGRGGWR